MDQIVDALKIFVNPETIFAFLVVIVPGTICLRVYDRLRARQSRKINETFVDVIIASFINDALWAVTLKAIGTDVHHHVLPSLNIAVTVVAAFLLSPIALTLLYAFVEDRLSTVGLVSDAEPRPWDKCFKSVKREKRDIAVILVMKSDRRAIAGRYVPPGFASSEPAEEAIHIGETWELDAVTGRFLRPIFGSLGMYVQMSQVETVEFLEWSSVIEYLPKEPSNGK